MTNEVADFIIDLTVVMKDGHQIFRHLPTGRETARVSCWDIPLFSTAELRRQERLIAEARVDTYGTHAPLDGWRGEPDSPLIGREHGMPEGWRDGPIEAADPGILLGDVLRLTISGVEWSTGSEGTSRVPVTFEQRLDQLILGLSKT